VAYLQGGCVGYLQGVCVGYLQGVCVAYLQGVCVGYLQGGLVGWLVCEKIVMLVGKLDDNNSQHINKVDLLQVNHQSKGGSVIYIRCSIDCSNVFTTLVNQSSTHSHALPIM
jgi:hypothetical protein